MPNSTTGSIPDTPQVTLNEAQLVQNTALGAVLIWLFVRSYNSKADHSCPLPLCFTILPILFHHATCKEAIGTSPASSLFKFVEKFDSKRELLLSIHDRMIALRPLSLRSIQLACSRDLLSVATKDAIVLHLRSTALPPAYQPERLRTMLRAAEKLGIWYAPHPISNVSSNLRVYF